MQHPIVVRAILSLSLILPFTPAMGQDVPLSAGQESQLREIQNDAQNFATTKNFQQTLEEAYENGEGLADLSQAAPGRRFYLYHHVQYRDNADAEFQDFKGKAPETVEVVPEFVAVDRYWSARRRHDAVPLTQMDSLYVFAFKIVGTTLHCHQILQSMSWLTGDPPRGREMPIVAHAPLVLESGQNFVLTRTIGTREFRITVGFFAR
jgi:hypothetical protein